MSVSAHHPVLLVAVPLIFAALCPILGMWKREACFPWALAGVGTTAFFAWSLIGKVSSGRAVTYNLSGWRPPWGIQIRIDIVGLMMACLVTGVGFLLVLYSWRYVTREIKPERIPYYYALVLLLITSMLGFSITGDLFNFFVFMEIFSIASYALVAVAGDRRAVRAALKYLLMGATSSLLVLFAIAFLYSVTGSLNMLDISDRLAKLSSGYLPVAAVALILFMVGFSVKSALFPLHEWLPDAHSIAPSPISAILSALVIKMGVLGILRILFVVYGPAFASGSASWSRAAGVISWAAAFAIVFGCSMAIIQTDFKLMIAYSSVSHVGYILLGVCMLSTRGMTGGLFNILAHAMGKACFFLVAGAFIYKHGIKRIQDLKGIGRTMPVTAGAFALASLSIVGVPPTAGFIAKWYILWGCITRGQYAFVVLVLLGSMLSAIYCFRVVYYMFFTGQRTRTQPVDEAPVTMYVPAALLSAGTLFFGVFASLVLPALSSAARALLVR